MDTPIIAALVAAVVALLGLLAKIQIARGAQRANESQPKIQALIATAASALEQIKRLQVETEKLRIRCWAFLDELEVWEPELLKGRQRRRLEESMIPITQQLDEFLDAWSTVKHELSDSAAIQVREARHACRNSVRAAQICCHLLVRQIQAKKGKQEIAATIASIRDELTRALNELDAFAALVTGPAGEKTQLIAPRTTI